MDFDLINIRRELWFKNLIKQNMYIEIISLHNNAWINSRINYFRQYR